MAALLSLQSYDSDSNESSSEKEESNDGLNAHLKPLEKSKTISSSLMLVAAPVVESIVSESSSRA